MFAGNSMNVYEICWDKANGFFATACIARVRFGRKQLGEKVLHRRWAFEHVNVFFFTKFKLEIWYDRIGRTAGMRSWL